MRLTFFGAAKAVTGSCHCVEVNGAKILIDCGLQQGRDEVSNAEFDFVPSDIECVIVTHAHIDHSGRLPLLVKRGFTGRIITTSMTAKLLEIMLRDSAHIQESDAEFQNRKMKRAGRSALEPLYTLADAEAALQHIVTIEYSEVMEVCPGCRIVMTDAGHLLGSAYVKMELTEGDVTKTIVFSGDIGNVDQSIIRDPQPINGADYVVMESTYGDRDHNDADRTGYYARDLAKIFDDTFSRGGNVIIPAFAVGRTQELLYFIREIKAMHMVKSIPDFRVCVDSPLAGAATRIYDGDLTGYLDEDAIALVHGGTDLFKFPGLTLCESLDESKALNTDMQPKVIISASGMCDAGRIRHHLKYNLWRPECTIVFVGFQAPGSFGRRILDGAASIKMFGDDIAVKAQIINFHGLSSHADRTHLIEWAKQFSPAPREFFIVHGEAGVTETFAQTLRELGISAHSANYEEVYDLATGVMLAPGIVRTKPKSSYVSDAYRYLEEAVRRLVEVVKNSIGRPNKDLTKFANSINALIDKWES